VHASYSIIVQVPEAVGVVPPLGPTVALKVMANRVRARGAGSEARVGVYLATEVV
jgi:hypothetical protein